ncbi:MAG: hypothetical protein J7L82_01820 [Staphylothermus sp.]|nr:hypothetical protein [Staphylothermus sp.]
MSSEGYRTLINNVYILSAGTITKGFIFFDNEKIIDIGPEASPEYELAEYVMDYEYKAVALHGFSVVTRLSNYPFRGTSNYDLSTYTKNEIKKFIQAGLYELILNGVTLPIVIDDYPELVAEVLRHLDINGVIVSDTTTKTYPGIKYLFIEENIVKYGKKELGKFNEIFCKLNQINDKCLFLDISDLPTYNISAISLLATQLGTRDSFMDLITKPYKVLNLDKGVINKGAKPDIVLYDLRDSLKTIPVENIDSIILRGYPPDQVYLGGDIFFDHGESLVLTKIDLSQFILSGQG